MTLDEEMTKIKVIDFKELYNFVVDNFLFEISYLNIMFKFLTFEI